MPHAIIANPPELSRIFDSFQPWKEALEDGTRLEGRAAYMRQDGNAILIESLAMELGPPQEFFVIVERKKQQLTVRCFAIPNPYRTPGVQAAVARVARFVLAQGGSIEKTNLHL